MPLYQADKNSVSQRFYCVDSHFVCRGVDFLTIFRVEIIKNDEDNILNSLESVTFSETYVKEKLIRFLGKEYFRPCLRFLHCRFVQ